MEHADLSAFKPRQDGGLAGIVLTIAEQKGIPLRWGGNWDQDGEPITDQDFQDLVHFELI